jgi:phosphoglycolate phosphatase-like HAD superfamily hydrolase
MGIVLGVVTSKTRPEMKNEFDIFGLNQYFKAQVTASDTELHKPNPDPIQKAINDLGADKSETVYIGDSLYDMKSAKSCGIAFCLAKWGAMATSIFTDIDFVLNSPDDILNLPISSTDTASRGGK